MSYSVEILVKRKPTVLDPEARAIRSTLENIGFKGINGLEMGRTYTYTTINETEELARHEAEEICKKLLANSVNEYYEITSVKKI